MTRTACTAGQWTEIATGVTSFNFNLINANPSGVERCVYKIHWGASSPAVDTTDFNEYDLDAGVQVLAFPISFNDTTSQNIYVLPVYEDGAVTF